MTSLAETTRPRAATRGPQETSASREAAGPRAVLRGESRPDLVRDETLSEIFRASARARGDHPALVVLFDRASSRDVSHLAIRADDARDGLLHRLTLG